MTTRSPQPQRHQTLDRLDLSLAAGSTLAYRSGQLAFDAHLRSILATALKQALNGAYRLRKINPPYPATRGAPAIRSLTVTLKDDRARNQPERRTVVRFRFDESGQAVTGVDATSEPGAIYLFVYDHDLGEIAREVGEKVLPILEKGR